MKRANQRKHHYIYKITRDDGKYYVGMHSTDNLDDGYFGSGMLLWKSIDKHGKDKHTKEILEFLPSREALKLREKEIVNEELLGDVKCMNLQLGGHGGDNGSFRKLTFEQKSAASKKAWTQHPDKMKMNRLSDLSGKNNPMFGRQHTPETKHQMSLKQLGSSNSQFGSCWVHNDQHVLKICGEELSKYVSLGYLRGRKI